MEFYPSPEGRFPGFNLAVPAESIILLNDLPADAGRQVKQINKSINQQINKSPNPRINTKTQMSPRHPASFQHPIIFVP